MSIDDILEAGETTGNVLSEVRAFCEQVAGDRRERYLAAVESVATAKTPEQRRDKWFAAVGWMEAPKTPEEQKQAEAEVNALLHPPEDSEQQYAEEILKRLDRAEGFRGMGRNEDAEKWTFLAGVNFAFAGAKFEWEDDASTGKAVSDGGEKGSEAVYGDEDVKTKRKADFQKVVDAVHRDHPEIGVMQVFKIASQRLKKAGEEFCSERSLRRHCKVRDLP